jgi:hypothetical protein
MTIPGLQAALDSGIGYLMSRQFDDGHFEDYDLPVGRSDAWITGYVGLALADVGRRRQHDGASDAARRAASWLARNRPYPAGWGYNGITGPDADSTGYAIRLLRRAGRRVRSEDTLWLLERWRPEGGFATYDGPGSWGWAHPDVTPVAFLALPVPVRERIGPSVAWYLAESRDADGTWPSYWWRTRHYSTYLNYRLARALRPEIAARPAAVTLEDSRAVHSAFDLAFVTATARICEGASSIAQGLTAELLAMQAEDGHWPGARNLRVTRHDTEDPWGRPQGLLYEDVDHLITTASVVAVLVEPRRLVAGAA